MPAWLPGSVLRDKDLAVSYNDDNNGNKQTNKKTPFHPQGVYILMIILNVQMYTWFKKCMIKIFHVIA